MVMTVRRCGEELEHALGGPGSLSQVFAVQDLVNRTGRFLASCWHWKWLERPVRKLRLRARVSGTATIDASVTPVTLTSVAAFADYTFLEGDAIDVTAVPAGSSAAKLGQYRVLGRTNDDTITLYADTRLGSSLVAGYSFDSVAGFAAVAPPSDFGRQITEDATNSIIDSFTMVSFTELLRFRTEETSFQGQDLLGALTHAQADAGGPPIKRIELWPTPESNFPDKLSLWYAAKWLEATSDEFQLGLPEFMEGLYLEMLRCFALGLQERDIATVEQRLSALLGNQRTPIGQLFLAARLEDEGTQTSFGEIQGGAVYHHATVFDYGLGATVAGPS